MKKIVNYRPLFYCFIALFGAILFAKYVFLSDWLAISLFVILIILITTIGILRKAFKNTLCILLLILLGLFSYSVEMNYFSQPSFPNETVFVGRVSGSTSTYGINQYVILEDVSVDGKEINQNVYLYLYGAPYLSSGDKIALVAKLSPISTFNKYGNVQTSFYKNNCYYTATKKSGTEITILGNNQKLNEKIQTAVKEKLLLNMTEKNANLAYAMLFGDKSDLDYQTKYDYQTSGIAHVLAVSGLHVGIVVSVLYWILKKLKAKNWVILLVIIPILIFYGYLCGFSASITRATIMSICLLVALCFGKRYDSLSAIGLAGLIILLFKPLYAFDVGFQLSFGCVIGIAIFYKSVYKFLRRNIGKFVLPNFIAKPLATTISTQFLILPVLISTFDGVSFLSIFINILIIPIFYVTFVITFISTPLIFISGFFGNFLWFSSLLMEFIGTLANFVSSLTWSIIPNFKFTFSAFVCFFALMFVLSRLVFLKQKTKLLTSLALISISSLIIGLLQLS